MTYLRRYLGLSTFSGKIKSCMYYSYESKSRLKTVDELFEQLVNGNRASLATTITLIESTRDNHKHHADNLLSKALSHLKKLQESGKSTFRIGLTGAPGAGKSSLIEKFGKKLTSEGHKVAVLAIDPSSVKTGGSLLGDRTRMITLSHDPNAYIRPSPTAGTLGGVARKTNEAIILCEAAGYDIILVETVGIGQSEVAVGDMVDMFVLVIPPASGDELQGIKKGIVEMVDLVLVNKADGDLLPAARRIQSEYTSALKLLSRQSDIWHPKVHSVSSLLDEGFGIVWAEMTEFKNIMLQKNLFYFKRKQQYKAWMWRILRENIFASFTENEKVIEQIKKHEQYVEEELMTPNMAANSVINFFKNEKGLK
ncbi:methylmalonic aciduria type A protein, mitochondrial isoform X1 [Hydra vulgaris]|uniref:methylmalonic aciduria type A protein, mitochondrial isoform X1 n=1 Tax=Hydra vulgaris TaxID=6087 RepID=UPI001F5FA148|nr:methylmalonic aciduria type A protein, mitochondrial [Hydra vulgaris]